MKEIIDCYERDFYVFSNFSSFQLIWKGKLYPTAEHAYHSEKFESPLVKEQIRNCFSAHEAFKMANDLKDWRVKNWDDIKVSIMEDILRAKVYQHPYVLKKLLQSGDRPIVECSWRDDFWGWGPNKDGQNMLGKLWMKIREDYINSESLKEASYLAEKSLRNDCSD